MKLKAAVIGLGGIGQDYDYSSPPEDCILTHANAFHSSKNFDLVGGGDINEKSRSRFEKKYSVRAFSDVRALMRETQPDVVAIAVPQEHQEAILAVVLEFRPRAVLCEKPFGWSTSEAEKMIEAAKSAGTCLMVNFFRRMEPGILALKQDLDRGRIGVIHRATICYTKGIRQNASHFINLMQLLFGEMKNVSWIRTTKSGADPEGDFLATFGSVATTFISMPSENYSLLEVELFGTLGAARLYGGGERIGIREVAGSPLFPNVKILGNECTLPGSDLRNYQRYVADSVFESLSKNTPFSSTALSALATTRAVDEILRHQGDSND